MPIDGLPDPKKHPGQMRSNQFSGYAKAVIASSDFSRWVSRRSHCRS